MPNIGAIVEKFHVAVVIRDIVIARRYWHDDRQFLGLFETNRSIGEYLTALTKLLQIVVRLDVKKIIAQGNDAAALFELETNAPAATTLVAEWHRSKTETSHTSSRPSMAGLSRPCSAQSP